MKVATGIVKHGQIVVEGQPFAEGEKVTVLSEGDGESFRVSPEEKRLLLESIAQCQRGETIPIETVLEELRGRA